MPEKQGMNQVPAQSAAEKAGNIELNELQFDEQPLETKETDEINDSIKTTHPDNNNAEQADQRSANEDIDNTIDHSPVDHNPVEVESQPDPAPAPELTNTLNRLEALADRLAHRHQQVYLVTQHPHPSSGGEDHPLPERLLAISTLLHEAHQQLVTTTEEALAVSYAAEWLLDNYYAVEQALRQVKQDLPATYYRELPRLAPATTSATTAPAMASATTTADPIDSARLGGYPRVYALARSYLLHEEFQVNPEWLTRFVHAYQQITPLTMGEIWAIPIMLRFVLLESMGRAAAHITKLSEVAEKKGEPLLANLQWEIDSHLTDAIALDDQDIVSSSIPSLRMLDTQDWKLFFEENSLVHQRLSADPAGIYLQMDFASRDKYRSAVEQIAHDIPKNQSSDDGTSAELAVAERAVALARAAHSAASNSSNDSSVSQPVNVPFPNRAIHVGYYLLGRGRHQLATELTYQPTGSRWLQQWVLANPTVVYLSGIGLLTLLLLLLPLFYAAAQQVQPLTMLGVFLLSWIPAVTIAVNAVNWLVTHLLPPTLLPKLALEDEIPAAYAAVVVIPALIGSNEDIDALLEQLEQHYLRNTDPNLRFALLSDFSDASEQVLPTDAALLTYAREQLTTLNERYTEQPFYFLHRDRLWNAREETWMGWERKRGKLHEFNQLIRGAEDTSYTVQLGRMAELSQTRYVITLDADTILPRDGAKRLIGTLAHPLNRAQFDAKSNKVIDGYTVLQPRTAIQPSSANRSLFTRVFGGDVGLDLYTLAVSDVYQDLFGEGIFVGKGIYDVDAFERSLVNRIPENSLLSHDLFEGIHGRAGLVTDIVLYEDYPPNYLVNLVRSHRWVRGDWQLLPWLFPLTPRTRGWRANDLPLISQWKIVDNLRRSVVPPALLLLFLAGWTILPGSPLFWTVLALFTPSFSLLSGAAMGVVQAITGNSGRMWARLVQPIRNNALRWLLFLAFLPHESLLILDAIARTLTRLFLTRRKLLEWTTAASAVRLFGSNVTVETTLLRMLPSILFVAVLALAVNFFNPAALLVSAPFFLVWLLAAEIAYWISRPIDTTIPSPSPEQRRQLRVLARRTWLFYEQFVGPDDNWLPPDHYQESPRGVVAHRTSPTNTGLYLISMLAAHDLGYLGTNELAVRLRFTFDTLHRLDRYRGHFLNWIDTSSLQPLQPSYVSTVDSGNLAGCLIALRQACLHLQEQRVWRWQWWEGLIDTLTLLDEAVAGVEAGAGVTQMPLRLHIHEMQQQVATARENPEAWFALLAQLATTGRQELDRRLAAATEQYADLLDAEILRNCRIYIERIHQHLQTMERELDQMLPWLEAFDQPPALFTDANAPASIRERWDKLSISLPTRPYWVDLANACDEGQTQLTDLIILLETLSGAHGATLQGAPANGDAPEAPDSALIAAARSWCVDLSHRLASAERAVITLLQQLAGLAAEAGEFVHAMEFRFLFHEERKVFHIGYNIDANRLDNNYYDLLASEARIASLVAIAKGDVPQQHWLHLARPLTKVAGGTQALLSWSGTMFEYLMPPLLMRSYPETLLYQSCEAAVDQQIAYGQERKVPWGISESGFYTFDSAMNYQYRAFGVPGLGFKRGLSDDLVIAPYASLLAIPLRPLAVIQNIEALQKAHALGRYGFYEALDFTASHLPLGQEVAIVRSYMAHHQGMVMLALADYLQGKRMVDRFHAEPMIQSVELLLQEQMPPHAPLQFPHEDEQEQLQSVAPVAAAHPWRPPVDSPMPLVHYLSNGNFGTLITNAGAGYSGVEGISFTRWRADSTLDNWGSWVYLQDLDPESTSMEEAAADREQPLWSIGRQPTGVAGEHEEVVFHPHMAEFRRRDHAISLHMEMTVAPDYDVEIRRINVTNESDRPRTLGLVGYGEVVLAPAAGDRRHPAFAKLFVESEYVPELQMLIFRRRPRAATEKPTYLAYSLVCGQIAESAEWGDFHYESDRARFLGRSHRANRPAALSDDSWWLRDGAGTTGATLDPVMALGQTITLAPHDSAQLALITLSAPTRAELIQLAQRYHAWIAIDRAFARARSLSDRELRQLSMTGAMLEQTDQLLSLLIYPQRAKRAAPAILAANQRGQSSLWSFGISGDYPILLLRMYEEADGELLQSLVLAHTYWRRRGLTVDLIILNQQDTNYGQPLQNYIHRLLRRMESDTWLNQRGGIFPLYADQMGEAERILVQSAAGVVLDGHDGTLAQQLSGLYQRHTAPLPPFDPVLTPEAAYAPLEPVARPTDLQFDNGYAGFSADGAEYLIYLRPGESTPAPWINVVANEEFGFLASETGGGYTWAINSGENRLTTWHNDPISDLPAEVLYLRDEETADVWTPTPQPAPAETPYLVRHGAGYTSYEHNSHGLEQHLRLFVAPDAPVKIVQLRLTNSGAHARRLTATYYAEWVLGVDRDSAQQFVISEYAEEAHALLARNSYSAEFSEAVAFVAASKDPHGLTADRSEFLGRLQSLRTPEALTRVGLTGRVEPGLDPCAALQIHIDLPANSSEEIYFLIGQGANREESLRLIQQYQNAAQVEETWQAVHRHWDAILGTVTVDTPDPAMNLLLNRWLLYQALACRIWGRSALYQSSGAYGFRDQLQDVMSLIHARPDLTRAQILRAARHQFDAGDVLHWWHPPAGRGVRTHITDDLAWLPYVTANYVTATGDSSILEEQMPFRRGDPLREGEEERYAQYELTNATHTLYEHCRRALDKAVTAGRHGIPLMGGGDWNDGMNRVGIEGKGESIWLGWFLHAALTDFARLSDGRNDAPLADHLREQAESIRQAIEAQGWDGAWYRRAYFDDGTPLGSQENDECRIDAIAQSWAVISHAAEPARAQQAMQSVREQLIKEEDRLLLLFTPPFDKTAHDPGYIKGYLPGIRENGGQYTHAALWTIWAFAELGDGDQAESLFRLINPIYRADSAEKADIYKVEPYVIAADVYGVAPHEGRGGWTWYTGSSGWMYRLGIEAILGLRRAGDKLIVDPCIPHGWPHYSLTYRYQETVYTIRIENPQGVCRGLQSVAVDGEDSADCTIPLLNDGGKHTVIIQLGADNTESA